MLEKVFETGREMNGRGSSNGMCICVRGLWRMWSAGRGCHRVDDRDEGGDTTASGEKSQEDAGRFT